MTEFSPIIFRALGLPIPEKGEKLPFNYNAITKEADGITDSNRDGKVDEKDRNGWIEPEELYELVNSCSKYAPVSRMFIKINSENPFRTAPEVKQHVKNLEKLHNPIDQFETAIIIFRSIIPSDESLELFEMCSGFRCYYMSYRGFGEAEGGLEIHYARDRSTLKREQGDLLPKQILKSRAKRAACTELGYLLVASLRAAGIESYMKVKYTYSSGNFGHVYVMARIDKIWYELDPAFLTFSGSSEHGESDRDGFAVYHLNKAKAFYKQGKLDRAMEHCEIALGFKPDFAAAWNNKGSIFIRQGEFNKARECYEKALKLEPEYIIALLNMGNLFEKQGGLEDAKRYYYKILGFRPDYALAWYKIGQVFVEQDKIKEASKYFRKAFELNPDLPKASTEVALLK